MSCTHRLILTWLVNIQTFEQVRTVSVSWNIYLYNHRYFLFPLYWMLVHCLVTPCGIWQICTGWVAPTVRSSSACLTLHAARREQIRWSKVNRTALWQNSIIIIIIIIIIIMIMIIISWYKYERLSLRFQVAGYMQLVRWGTQQPVSSCGLVFFCFLRK